MCLYVYSAPGLRFKPSLSSLMEDQLLEGETAQYGHQLLTEIPQTGAIAEDWPSAAAQHLLTRSLLVEHTLKLIVGLRLVAHVPSDCV